MRRPGALVAASLLAAVVVAGAACAGDDDGDVGGRIELEPSTTVAVGDIYDPPTPLPGSAPGELIAAERATPPSDAPAGARAWRVLYRSTSLGGSPTGVTGVIVLPPEDAPVPPGGRPVLTWGHGTTGIADTCAPSRRVIGSAWLAPLLDRGFAVAVTDYEGLGTPGVHPYLVGVSEGRSVLDAARAVSQLDEAAVAPGGPVVVAGHSQGGHAALFAAAIAPEYAPDLRVAGVVAVAPPTDLPGMARPFLGSPILAGFVATVATGYASVYPELALSDVLTPEGLEISEAVHEVCLDGVVTRAVASGLKIAVDDPLAVDAWARRVRENVPPPPPAGMPVYVLQGGRDPIVPGDLTRRFAEDACTAGSTVRLAFHPDDDHGTVLVTGREDVLAWIDARVSGAPVGAGEECPAAS